VLSKNKPDKPFQHIKKGRAETTALPFSFFGLSSAYAFGSRKRKWLPPMPNKQLTMHFSFRSY